MTTRIAINGLGRVGRALLRQAVLSEELEVVGVNDLADPHTLRSLLRRDSTYGAFPVEVEAGDDCLVIGGHKIPWSNAATPAELPWGELRRRRGRRVHRQVPDRRDRRRPPRGRRPQGRHLGPGQGRRRDHRHGHQRRDLRPGAPRRRLQRLLHHQLRRTDGQGAARGLRDPAGVHDHGARLHRRPEPARRPAQGPPPRPVGRGQHHPDHHRRGPRGGPGPPRAGRQAGRRRPAGARGRRVRSSTWPCSWTARSPSTRSTPSSRRPPAATSSAGGCATRTEPFVSVDVIGDSASCVFDSSLTQASGRFVKVFGWYDNEWGYVCRLAELVRLVGAGTRGPVA